MNLTDVAGFTLKNAEGMLHEMGIKTIDIKVTAPPKMRGIDYDSSFRVLSVKRTDKDKVELIVAKPL